MLVLSYRNVHEALPEAFKVLNMEGDDQPSRNGPVKEYYCPVTTCYAKPQERVGFWKLRDANPFFHFFESLWMLAGRNDVEFPLKFNSKFGQYSDDGMTFHGAYGHRWRNHFQFDQLAVIIKMLKENDMSRRVVLQMWDGMVDLNRNGKDIPCNTQCYFWIRHRYNDPKQPKVLHMTVMNRSNDIIFGCYGANAVHFSFLQEYLAQMIGVGIGIYTQISNNWHTYTEFPVYRQLLPMLETHEDWAEKDNPYATDEVNPSPLVTVPAMFDADLEMFLEAPLFYDQTLVCNDFINHTARPMYLAYEAFKSNREDRVDVAIEYSTEISASDWRKACVEWLQRRHNLIKKEGQCTT